MQLSQGCAPWWEGCFSVIRRFVVVNVCHLITMMLSLSLWLCWDVASPCSLPGG